MKPYLKNTKTIVLDRDRQVEIMDNSNGYSVYNPRTGDCIDFCLSQNAVFCALCIFFDMDICSITLSNEFLEAFNLLSLYVQFLDGDVDFNLELIREEKEQENENK